MSIHRTLRGTAFLRGAALSALTLTLAVACGDGDLGPGPGTGETDPDGKDPTTWNPSGETGECNVDALLEPYSYVNKVKSLLTGLAVDDAELALVEGALPVCRRTEGSSRSSSTAASATMPPAA